MHTFGRIDGFYNNAGIESKQAPIAKRKKLLDKSINGRMKITKTKNNALDLDLDVILSLLASGRRDPQNEQERIWLQSIEETKAKGKGIDIPFK